MKNVQAREELIKVSFEQNSKQKVTRMELETRKLSWLINLLAVENNSDSFASKHTINNRDKQKQFISSWDLKLFLSFFLSLG